MHKGNRLIATAISMLALVAVVVYGCQTQDNSFPTEAERTLQTTAVTKEQVNALIDGLMDPVLGKSSKKQFASIVTDLSRGKIATAQAKALSLTAFIRKHYQDGKWIDPDGSETGALNLAILQFAGIIDDDLTDAAAAECLPGNECETTPPSEEGVTTIPGDLITQPFTLIMFQTDCAVFGPNAVPPCYEIQTIPAGLSFGTSASGSLSLSQVDLPIVSICSEFTQAFTPGVDVFLWHAHDGVVEPVAPEPVVICDGPALSSRWANPLLATFQPVLMMLSPQPLYAKGTGLNIGGGISNFSVVGSCLPGCLPTTTTASIVGGETTFSFGDTITFRAVVDPAPGDGENGLVLFFPTSPAIGDIASEEVIGGEAVQSFVCGEDRVPPGSHTAAAVFFGTTAHGGSESNELEYTCLESAG